MFDKGKVMDHIGFLERKQVELSSGISQSVKRTAKATNIVISGNNGTRVDACRLFLWDPHEGKLFSSPNSWFR